MASPAIEYSKVDHAKLTPGRSTKRGSMRSRQAGFTHVRRAAETPFNLTLEIRR